jgi:hypothetical protein
VLIRLLSHKRHFLVTTAPYWKVNSSDAASGGELASRTISSFGLTHRPVDDIAAPLLAYDGEGNAINPFGATPVVLAISEGVATVDIDVNNSATDVCGFECTPSVAPGLVRVLGAESAAGPHVLHSECSTPASAAQLYPPAAMTGHSTSFYGLEYSNSTYVASVSLAFLNIASTQPVEAFDSLGSINRLGQQRRYVRARAARRLPERSEHDRLGRGVRG